MKGKSLQDPYLNTLRKGNVQVNVYLVSGIKLTGYIESFDQFVVVLRDSKNNQMIYKHAISTVVPSEKITLPTAERGKELEE